MKLIFIYGPPAVGKLTIAEKLSQKTGIPLFHNHLSRDLVQDIYKNELTKHYGLVDQIRYDVLDYCSKNNTDLIFTYVYFGAEDDSNIRKFIDIIEGNDSEVIFVELTATQKDLISRVGNNSRTKHKKLTDPDTLANITTDMGLYSIPFVKSINIDTSALTPDEAAATIADNL